MKRYEKYKESGVDWIGEIPESWEVRKLKSFLTVHGRIGFRGYTVSDLVDKGEGAITLSPSNMTDGKLNFESSSYLSWEKYFESPEIMVELEDFLLVKTASIGKLAYVKHLPEKATVNPQILVLKNVNICNPFFFYQLLSTVIQKQLQTEKIGSTIFTISETKIKNFLSILPPPQEQQAIATFLDDKTSKIDQLIQIKQKEIKLLKERRQILIQKLVTKGLDPTVKMKDSGVDWIGEIPEHWEVRKLKYVFDFIRTGTTPPTGNQNYFDGEINWFNPKDLNEGILVEAEKKISNFAISQKEIKMFPGDSILIVGIGATSGKTAYLVNNATFNQQITGFHSITENNKFYYYFMKCATTLMLNLANYTTLPILNNEFFKSFLTIVPPINEQIQIVTYIEEKDEKMSKAILLKQQEMEKLNEYKTVLIDNVVTGKEKVKLNYGTNY